MGTSMERKIGVALAGLFLCVFLVVHLAGNLVLLLPPGEARPLYNAYSAFLVANPLIKLISYVLYASIALHAGWSLALAWRNRRAAGSPRYATNRPGAVSSWASRRMTALGLVLLAFLVVHMRTFWFTYHFGALELDAQGHRDLYGVVQAAFARPWYVALYVASMGALGLHLAHGAGGATRTMGVYGRKSARGLRRLGIGFAAVMALGFAILPVWVFFDGAGAAS
jgi:succinate dehydrogenase / fumarate reductase, cytochrome b subunit